MTRQVRSRSARGLEYPDEYMNTEPPKEYSRPLWENDDGDKGGQVERAPFLA